MKHRWRHCGKYLGMLVGGLAMMAAPAHASILGDTINVEWDFPSFGSSISSLSTTVPGTVNPGLGVSAISITDGTITLQNDTYGWSGDSGFNGFIFTDLSKVPDFTSFSLVSIGGFPPPVDPILSFNPDQLIVNFNADSASNTGSDVGQLYTFSFTSGQASVPEPSTLLLLGSGLAGLGIYGRKFGGFFKKA